MYRAVLTRPVRNLRQKYVRIDSCRHSARRSRTHRPPAHPKVDEEESKKKSPADHWRGVELYGPGSGGIADKTLNKASRPGRDNIRTIKTRRNNLESVEVGFVIILSLMAGY